MPVNNTERARDMARGEIPWRAIALLSLAAFASAASIRVADPLLPAIGREFRVSTGDAANVMIAFSISYGMFQLVGGLVGDRFGKFNTVMFATLLSGIGTLLSGWAVSLETLTLARLASGATAAAIVPMALAWIGDAVGYEHRQVVLARFLPGQILGVVLGQTVGGVLGDYLGWRSVFLVIACLQFAVVAAMLFEFGALRRSETARKAATQDVEAAALMICVARLVRDRWARTVLVAVFIEGFAVFGALAFLASYLQADLHISAAGAGLVTASFGIGGLIYSVTSPFLLARLGQIGSARRGGLVLSVTFGLFSALPTIWFAPVLSAMMGLGFYMLHNILQVSATQLSHEARGTAMAVYASSLFFGQTFGVAVAAVVFDRFGAPPIFIASSIILPLLASWFAAALERLQQKDVVLPP